jgi:hypothetical protein
LQSLRAREPEIGIKCQLRHFRSNEKRSDEMR